MRGRDFFPLGLASGQAFCNRKEETKALMDNIKHGKHTLLMATRRYGKSSLSLHALKKVELPYVEIDFYMASSEKAIETYILRGINELMTKSLGSIEKLLNSLKGQVKRLKPKIVIGEVSLNLELTADAETDPASNIKEGLLLLEKLLEEKKTHAVLLMDEFQNVGTIAKGMGIEGAIRHVAQKTKYLTFIFSGSNRKLLATMFDDDTRPLYKLCLKLDLKRILPEHYKNQFIKAAKTSWKVDISDSVIQEILLLTERHPYYVNKLCDNVWSLYTEKSPTIKEVNDTWNRILEEEKSDAVKEISSLSMGQKEVLPLIARGNTSQFTSKDTILELKMTGSSISTALDALEEKDIIEKIDNQYRIINPVIAYYALKGS